MTMVKTSPCEKQHFAAVRFGRSDRSNVDEEIEATTAKHRYSCFVSLITYESYT